MRAGRCRLTSARGGWVCAGADPGLPSPSRDPRQAASGDGSRSLPLSQPSTRMKQDFKFHPDQSLRNFPEQEVECWRHPQPETGSSVRPCQAP
ncbi:hypothetical protein NDU88_009016 [Pleurodeles waltl]|uniref:Uncharacterized protein n=1 Tax=Pleurodeles waltl TaxID=8319 RepID=A0AAV7NY01_PLEWA|nr:hypothetical protein NDU88_009016 [Pleurodeles waltl]